MGRGEKMAKNPERTAKMRESQQALKAEFKEKFGHAYDPQGYHGHPLFGYHCYGCGIHITKITNKGLREQLELAQSRKSDTVKLRTPGKPSAQESPRLESFPR